MEKPHKGRITNVKYAYPINPGEGNLGYFFFCDFIDHPIFANQRGHTSMIVKDDCDIPRHLNDGYEVETLNSRYTVIS